MVKVMDSQQMNDGGVYTHVLQAAQTLFAPAHVVELRALFKNDRADSGWRVFFGAIFEVVGESNPFSTKALMELISGDFENFFRGKVNGQNCHFSPESLPEEGSVNFRNFSREESRKKYLFFSRILGKTAFGRN
jgi:hypothetical protein